MTVRIGDVTCEGETDDAIFVSIEGEEFCIPKSQLDDDSEVFEKGTEGYLIITDWIARKEGLEDSE